jgi:cell division septation protein DedD
MLGIHEFIATRKNGWLVLTVPAHLWVWDEPPLPKRKRKPKKTKAEAAEAPPDKPDSEPDPDPSPIRSSSPPSDSCFALFVGSLKIPRDQR